MIYCFLAYIDHISGDQVTESFDRKLLENGIRSLLNTDNSVTVSPFWPSPFIQSPTEQTPMSKEAYTLICSPLKHNNLKGYFFVETKDIPHPMFLVSTLNDLPHFKDKMTFLWAKQTEDPEQMMQEFVDTVSGNPSNSESTDHLVQSITNALDAKDEVAALVKKHYPATIH